MALGNELKRMIELTGGVFPDESEVSEASIRPLYSQ